MRRKLLMRFGLNEYNHQTGEHGYTSILEREKCTTRMCRHLHQDIEKGRQYKKYGNTNREFEQEEFCSATLMEG